MQQGVTGGVSDGPVSSAHDRSCGKDGAWDGILGFTSSRGLGTVPGFGQQFSEASREDSSDAQSGYELSGYIAGVLDSESCPPLRNVGGATPHASA